MKKSVAMKLSVIDMCGYALLFVAGILAIIKGDFAVAALIFFGIAVVMPLFAGNMKIDPRARKHMPDTAEIKRYRKQHSDVSLTDAINSIAKRSARAGSTN